MICHAYVVCHALLCTAECIFRAGRGCLPPCSFCHTGLPILQTCTHDCWCWVQQGAERPVQICCFAAKALVSTANNIVKTAYRLISTRWIVSGSKSTKRCEVELGSRVTRSVGWLIVATAFCLLESSIRIFQLDGVLVLACNGLGSVSYCYAA